MNSQILIKVINTFKNKIKIKIKSNSISIKKFRENEIPFQSNIFQQFDSDTKCITKLQQLYEINVQINRK